MVQDSPEVVTTSSEEMRNKRNTTSRIDEFETVTIINGDLNDQLSRMSDSQQAIKGNLIETFDVSKLNAAFDIMFELITVQQKDMCKVNKRLSLVEEKQSDYEGLSSTVHTNKEKQDIVNADMLSAIAQMMMQIEKLSKFNDLNAAHLAKMDSALHVASMVPEEMRSKRDSEENLQNKLNLDLNAPESNQSKHIEDIPVNNSTNANSVTSTITLPGTDTSSDINVDHHYVIPTTTSSEIKLNSNPMINKVDNKSDHHGSDMNSLSENRDMKNNKSVSSDYPRNDPESISNATILLEIEKMKRSAEADALAIQDKNDFDDERFNLLQERTTDHEDFSRSLESIIDEQKKELNIVQKTLNIINKSLGKMRNDSEKEAAAKGKRKESSSSLAAAEAVAGESEIKQFENISSYVPTIVLKAMTSDPIQIQIPDLGSTSTSLIFDSEISLSATPTTATATGATTSASTAATTTTVSLAVAASAMDVQPVRSQSFEITKNKENEELKELLNILNNNGGILRIFNAINDLGFQKSGEWNENIIIDRDNILYKIVKKICDDLLKDIENIAEMASDYAAAADTHAIIANESADIATSAALSANNTLLAIKLQIETLPPTSFSLSPTAFTSSSPSSSLLESSEIIQNDSEGGKEREPKGIGRVEVEERGRENDELDGKDHKSNLLSDLSSIITNTNNNENINKNTNTKNDKNIDDNTNTNNFNETNTNHDSEFSSPSQEGNTNINRNESMKENSTKVLSTDKDNESKVLNEKLNKSSKLEKDFISAVSKSNADPGPGFQDLKGGNIATLSSNINSDTNSNLNSNSTKNLNLNSNSSSTGSGKLSNKNIRTPGRDQNRDKEREKNKDMKSPLQLIRDQRNIEEEKEKNKKDLNDIKKEISIIKDTMILKNDFNSMLSPNNIDHIKNSLSAQLRSLILSTINTSLVLPISYSTEITKLKDNIYCQLQKIEEDILYLKTKDKNEPDNNFGSYQKDKTNFASKPEVARITDSVKKLTIDQEESLNQFLIELRKLQNQVDLRPSEEKLQSMVESMDATFKKELGDNVTGLKLSVGQVLKLVEQKANKNDVLSMLNKSMSVVDENNHILVERDVNYVAGSVKCISCGTNYNSRGRGSGGGGESPERWQKFTNNRLQNQNRNYHSSVVTGITASTSTSTSTSAPCGIDKQIDVIEIHNGITPEQLLSIDQLHGLSVADYSRREAEAYLAVTRRQGGLKPLNRHFQPMQIKSNPNMNPGYRRAATANSSSNQNNNDSTYRKSRFIKHLKDLSTIPNNIKFSQSQIMYADDDNEEIGSNAYSNSSASRIISNIE